MTEKLTLAQFIVIQIVGAIGYGLLSYSYHKEKKNEILYLQIIANVFFTIHYFLLSGISGAISNLIGLISYGTIYAFDNAGLKKEKNIFTAIMIVLLLIISLGTVHFELNLNNLYAMLPFIAFTFTIISFLNGKENVIRSCGLVAAVCWLIYAILFDSYAAIVFEVFTLISTFIALFKNLKIITKK